jgi:predicted ATP-binding protein involved in virulence
MKLHSIRIVNNPIFGKDFSLSFTDKNWQVMDTVILAGENGCGKTSVLEMIYEVLFPRDRGNNMKKMFPNEERYYTYTLNEDEELEFISALQQTSYKDIKQLQNHQLTIYNKNNQTSVIVKHGEWELNTESNRSSIKSFLQKYIKVTY